MSLKRQKNSFPVTTAFTAPQVVSAKRFQMLENPHVPYETLCARYLQIQYRLSHQRIPE